MELADEALLKRSAKGDRQASALLINRHSSRVLSLAQRMLGSREDAEDVSQEVFLKVFQQADKWVQKDAKFSTWLHRVTLNQCYDRLRKKREMGMAEPPDREDDSPGPPEQMLARQRQVRLQAAIAELPERQRAALLLSHYEEMNNIEAADVLEISVEAVESLLSRARRSLRQALSAERSVLMGQVE